MDRSGLVWRLVNAMSFLSIDPETSILTGTPGRYDIGEFFIKIRVSDGEWPDMSFFYLTVLDVNDPPMRNGTKTIIREDETLNRNLSNLFYDMMATG
jgi:hypothetical protein